ncbi:hypothetical protein V8E53_004142 [Lactarius tabidus]
MPLLGANEMPSMPSTAFGPPFDHVDADIILRSSDQSMFSLPQPNISASKKQITSVDLPENSKTIATLLTYIYTGIPAEHDVEPESLDDMMDALVAAKKYDMASVSRCLNQMFAESKFVQDDPMVAFCTAYARELGETCRIAAKASLERRMSLDNIVDKLQCMTIPAFDQLYKFHRACSVTAVQAVCGTNLN